LLLSGCAGGKGDKVSSLSLKNPIDLLKESAQAMGEIKNYQVEMNINVNVTGELKPFLSAKGIVQLEPQGMVMEGTLNIEKQLTPLQIYLERNEDGSLTEYVKAPRGNDYWKATLQSSPQLKHLNNPASILSLITKNLTAAQVIGEQKKAHTSYILIEATAGPEGFLGIYNQINNPVLNNPQFLQTLKMANKLTYRLWLERDSLYVTRISVDLMDSFKEILHNLSPEAQERLGHMLLTLEFNLSNFNEDLQVVIPPDVKKQARDMPLPFNPILPEK
jgi:hypothetical protein